jgi:hypothetical protein
VLLTPSKLTELFGRLGAKDEAANPASVMAPSFEAPSSEQNEQPEQALAYQRRTETTNSIRSKMDCSSAWTSSFNVSTLIQIQDHN